MYTLEELKQEIVKQERVVEDAKNLLEYMGVLAKEMEEEGSWPKVDDYVYWLAPHGTTPKDKFSSLDPDVLRQGNVFKTRKEAEQEAERREIMQELRMCDGIRKPDDECEKFYIRTEKGIVNTGIEHDIHTSMNQVYFKTEKDAKNAIEKIGEERLRNLF